MTSLFPCNAIVTVTHGSCHVPDFVYKKLHPDFTKNNSRLLKNFSDFATKELVPTIAPNNQVVVAHFSRAVGDLNRSKDAPDLFRTTDFAGNAVWKTPLTDQEKQQLLQWGYDVYHAAIQTTLQQALQVQDTVIQFEIHDTGDLELFADPAQDKIRAEVFPDILVSNRFGTSCRKDIFAKFISLLTKEFGNTIVVNDPDAIGYASKFSGGFVTRQYGEIPNVQQEFAQNVIQLEFARRMYLDETTQVVDPSKIVVVQQKLERAIIATAKEFEV